MNFDTASIRNQFPQLQKKVRGKDWVYLDSAATTLKPTRVIERLTQFYTEEVSNVHRGAHWVSDQATTNYEKARENVAQFIGAHSTNEIIFTKGTTESINLVAQSCGPASNRLQEGDEIILSSLEHHSNIVPWQKAVLGTGAKIRFIPVKENRELDFEFFQEMLSPHVKIVSLTYVSNTLGTTVPVKKFFDAAHSVGALTILDAAQAMSIYDISVQELGCDFLAFSGHKLFAPFGIGVLWGKEMLLNAFEPYQGGGSMIKEVTKDGSTFLDAPFRFEAGTPNVSGALGLSEAIDFLKDYDLKEVINHERQLVQKIVTELKKHKSTKILSHEDSINIVSFVIDGAHPSDVGQILDQQGVAIRVGHHCTQPLMEDLKIDGTIRVSLSIYNDESDVDKFLQALNKSLELLVE